MRPSLRFLLPALLSSALAGAPGAARADDTNFRPYIIGSRAAGMGGAFTAIADDGSGPYYNPGGLAFVHRSQLSLSGSVYGLVNGTFKDALGDGHDFSYHSLNIFPTTTSAVWRLGPADAPSGDVLAVSVFVPDAYNADGRDQLVSSTNAFFFTTQVQTVWGGGTYARRIGKVGIGVTGFVLFGTRLAQLDLTEAVSSSEFATISERIDETTFGVLGAAGVRWDATDQLSLGLSVYSPAWGGGSRRVFARVTAAPLGGGTPQIAVNNVDGLNASPAEPMRIQAGVAWRSGPLTLAADAIYLAAREVVDDEDRAPEGLERRIVRKAVVNGSVGMEYVIQDRFPFRAGFFTDFAASPDSSAASDAENTNHINRFGGTASIGLRTEHTNTDFGVNVSAGSGNDTVPNNLDFTQLKVSGASQLLLYVFLGTSYEF
jgi:long-chain fatty acid transport protein